MFVLGALILFDPAGDAYQVSMPVAIGIAAGARAPPRLRDDESRCGRLAARSQSACTAWSETRASCAATGWCTSTASSGARAAPTATPLVPGEHVRVEEVEDDLRLVVGSMSTPTEEEPD